MILGIKMKLVCVLLVATVMAITIDGVYANEDCSPPDQTPVSPDKSTYKHNEIVEIGNPVDYELLCYDGKWYTV